MKFVAIRTGSILLAIAVSFLVQIVASRYFSGYAYNLVWLASTYVTLAVSLNLINGITGQFSIGHYAFFQIGAYTAGAISQAVYAKQQLGPDLWVPLMMIAGGITAAIAGFIVGLPSLRLKGDYLAIVTLGFGEIVRIATNNITYTGAAAGMQTVPSFHGLWLIVLLAIVTVALCRNLVASFHGLQFLAVREDEVAASAMGIKNTRVKVISFVIGSSLAGIAGAFYAHFNGYLVPSNFTMDNSFIVLTMVQLGGTGSITGSIIGAISLFYLPEGLRSVAAVPMNLIIGSLLATFIGVGVMKYLIDSFHGKNKTWYLVGTAVLVPIAAKLIALIAGLIPGVAQAEPVSGGMLRLPIFAVVLVAVMLLRPQGLLGQYELSVKWVLGLFKRKQSNPSGQQGAMSA